MAAHTHFGMAASVVAVVGWALQALLLALAGGTWALQPGLPAAASLQRLSQAPEWTSYDEREHQGPGTYAFGYDVDDPETGNTQFRSEERHPNGTVTGSYGLVLPDGNVQIVYYTADQYGYRARVETRSPRGRSRAGVERGPVAAAGLLPPAPPPLLQYPAAPPPPPPPPEQRLYEPPPADYRNWQTPPAPAPYAFNYV